MVFRVLWPFVAIGSLAFQLVFPFLIVRYLRWPRPCAVRALSSVIVCWIGSVAYAIYVYCPVGIARAEYLGSLEPWRGFDNNNIAPLILGGWIFPAIIIGMPALGRWFLRNFGDPKLNPK